MSDAPTAWPREKKSGSFQERAAISATRLVHDQRSWSHERGGVFLPVPSVRSVNFGVVRMVKICGVALDNAKVCLLAPCYVILDV